MKLKIDSRKVLPGDTFIALRSIHDGHNYVEDAIKKGATTVVVEEGQYDVNTIVVKDTKEYLINELKNNYYQSIKNIKLIGVTGTNGKTTTAYLIWQMLNKLGHKCAYIGTIGFFVDSKIRELNNTTPEILDVYNMIIECQEKNCQYVVMEASSHALAMRRLEGLEYTYTIFTNLTEDHLDYHKTMEEYAKTKQKIFDMLTPDGKNIINIDDQYGKQFKNENSITYGFEPSNYQISQYKTSYDTKFTIINDNKELSFDTSLLGKYNVYNLTAAIIILKEIGISYQDIKTVVKEITAPTGRMDTINYNDNKIIIDYAHTPDAVSNIINAVREFATSKIYTILGCGGDRDKSKRPIMATLATTLSDHVIFTSDNPRTEDPHQIIQDMIQNLTNTNYETVVNREKAIEKGVQILEENDILLILGKGHETYQVINTEKIHFDDKEKVLENIRR